MQKLIMVKIKMVEIIMGILTMELDRHLIGFHKALDGYILGMEMNMDD
jgi:hypothetical protein